MRLLTRRLWGRSMRQPPGEAERRSPQADLLRE
jgi:hypothetical protein